MAKSKEIIVDLEENLNNLSQQELKQKVLNWIRSNGISNKLHSQLRCDLIAQFNKTHLGRHIQSQFLSEYRMVLSPVIRSLNTLVAEFLYAQNCHYSLSVFSTEVPFKNTLPEFEKQNHFRFTKSEIDEIFQAVGINSNHLSKIIATSYDENKNKDNNSLLYFIFENAFYKNALKKSASSISHKLQSDLGTSESSVHVKCPNCETNVNLSQVNHLFFNKVYLKYLNKYFYASMKKIYGLAKQNAKLKSFRFKQKINKKETRQKQNRPLEITKEQDHDGIKNLLILNKRLENLTVEFEKLMNADKINKDVIDYNFMVIINDVIRITNNLNEKFENCNQNVTLFTKYINEKFQNGVASQKLNEDKKELEPNKKLPEVTYKEWLEGMKDSKHGKKFLKKLEANFVKALLKQKQTHEKEYKEQLEQEKTMIKLHFRQKYLEHLNKASFQESESLKKIVIKENKLQNTEVNYQPDRVIQTIEMKPSITNTNAESLPNINHNVKKRLSLLCQSQTYTINIDPVHLDDGITQTQEAGIVGPDYYKYDLVLDTKKRINELERENEELDESLQKYLNRQITEKFKYKICFAKILHRYETDRVAINSKKIDFMDNKNEEPGISEVTDLVNLIDTRYKYDNCLRRFYSTANNIVQGDILKEGVKHSKSETKEQTAQSPVE